LDFDDVDLITMISQGDSTALDQLYERYHRLIFSIAINSIGDHALAEEITLDIFTRVWQKANQYRPEKAQVSTWLVSMTRNRCIDMLRRQRARREHQRVDWAEVQSVPGKANPEASAALRMQKQRVREAVHQLPSDQREALALAFFKGYTHREVAEQLELPLGTVKTRIRLAMKKLRDALSEELYAGTDL